MALEEDTGCGEHTKAALPEGPPGPAAYAVVLGLVLLCSLPPQHEARLAPTASTFHLLPLTPGTPTPLPRPLPKELLFYLDTQLQCCAQKTLWSALPPSVTLPSVVLHPSPPAPSRGTASPLKAEWL